MASVLRTDGYKFSMAAAGWPLRHESFYYSHRRGGPHYLPFDVEPMIRSFIEGVAYTAGDDRVLRDFGYDMGGGYWSAMQGELTVDALPRGSWFFDREPVFSVTGPSALVSWLEPLALQLHYRIQIATLALLRPEQLPTLFGRVSCDAQAEVARETLDSVGVSAPPIHVEPEAYYAEVHGRASALVDIVGDPGRIFEVGMRAAVCTEQHRIALSACRDAGIVATSNVELAHELGMRAVGTMGHEHVQRYGSDRAAFQAMRDRFPGPSSFLLDTFDTISSGIPTALDLISEDPSRKDSMRFDSGDKRSQYLIATALAKQRGVRPSYILEDGFDMELTQEFEELRPLVGLEESEQLYGYGGHLVKADGDPLTRDRVGAVYKLARSGQQPTMKFGDAPGAGKESIPGRPVLYRPRLGSADHSGPTGIVAQEGEAPPAGAIRLTGAGQVPPALRFTADEVRGFATFDRPAPSPATAELIDQLTAARKRQLGK